MAETFDAIHVQGIITVGDQNQQDAKVEIKSPLDGISNRFVADAEGNVLVGGNRANGILIMFNRGSTHDDLSRATVHLNGETGLLELGLFDKGETKITIQLRSNDAAIRAGGQGTDGKLILERKDGKAGVEFNAEHAQGVLGGEGVAGSLTIASESANPGIELKGDDAEIHLGGIGKSGTGRIVLKNPEGIPKITLSGHAGRVSAMQGHFRDLVIDDDGGTGRVGIDGNSATMRVGFKDKAGHVILRSDKGETIQLNGETANIRLNGGGTDDKTDSGIELDGDTGRIMLKNPEGISKITLSGHAGRVTGMQGHFRDLVIDDNSAVGRVGIDGETATMRVGFKDKAGHVILRSDKGETIHLDGKLANMRLGGNGADGDLLLFANKDVDLDDATKATIHLDGESANMRLGGNGSDGDLLLFASTATDTNDATQAAIHLDAEGGSAWLGGNGIDGDLVIFSKKANTKGITNAADKTKLASVHLNGDAGDIILRNADCAEEFNVIDAEHIEPGTLLVISSENELAQSTHAYDRRVAGIVSGAGDYKPGILLDRQLTSNLRLPIALMGKAYCKVDASYHPIEVGDLLTSSDTPGHAMRVIDPTQATGAIIGKALKPLRSGTGLIPVLVALQ